MNVSRGPRPVPPAEPEPAVREAVEQAEIEVENGANGRPEGRPATIARDMSGFTAWTFPLRTRTAPSARVSARTASRGLSRCRRVMDMSVAPRERTANRWMFISVPEPESDQVFVVDQVDADTQAFDEHKAMLGYPSEEAAKADYDAAFGDGRGSERRGAVTPMSVRAFRNWLENGDTTKPVNQSAALSVPTGATLFASEDERAEGGGDGSRRATPPPPFGKEITAREITAKEIARGAVSKDVDPKGYPNLSFERTACRTRPGKARPWRPETARWMPSR